MFVIAKALLVNEKQEVLAIRRSKTDVRRPLQWDFPGGFVERDEDTRAAVIREVKEEVGIDIHDPVVAFGMSEPADDGRHGTGTWLMYIARVKGRPKVTLSMEHDDFKWTSVDELLAEMTYERQLKMLRFIKQYDLVDDTFSSL